MKKKIFGFVLALCLIIPSMFMLTACGESENAYGKTFAYNCAKIGFENDYFNGVKLADYISQNIATINWAETLEDKNFTEGVQTLARAEELLTNKAHADFSEKYKNLTIAVSKESEHKLTINSVDYTFQTKKNGNLVVYGAEEREIITLNINLVDNKLKYVTPTFDMGEGAVIANSFYSIEIKLTSGEESEIFINPVACFKAV